MSAASMLAYRMMGHGGLGGGVSKVDIKRGDDAIFGDGPYPRTMTEFIGQDLAKVQLLAAMSSALKRHTALDHVLFASGTPGIGKTTLAKIIASLTKRGYIEVGGNVTVKDVRPILEAMQEGDVLFLDEIHRLVSVKRANAEWLLQLLTDFQLVLPGGTVQLPRITVIGATTDAQKLPKTILDRFILQPQLEPYTPAEGVEIAKVTARRLDVLLEPGQLHQVAAAADYNPRVMGRLLTAVRDIQLGEVPTTDVIQTALEWTGVTYDGLGRTEQDYLMALHAYGGSAGIGTIKAILSESALDQTEKVLICKGYIVITGKGRELTRLGMQRASQLLNTEAPEEEEEAS